MHRTSAIADDQPVTPNSGASAHGERATETQRIDALDFVKGVLVFFMVLYHSLNYSADRSLPFRYLAFLPPSFIVITGFLLVRVYFTRPANADASTRWRLLVRGAKLVGLFTLLNVGASLVLRRNIQGKPLGADYLLGHWFDVYITGEGWAAFEVLLPIGYLVAFGAGALLLHRWRPLALQATAILVILVCVACEVAGALVSNGALLGAGALGIMLGRLPDRVLSGLRQLWPLAIAVYAGYALSALVVGQPFLMQLSGATIALAFFYGVGANLSHRGWMQRRVFLLGQYSLFAYVSQIAILQLLSRWVYRPEATSPAFLALFGAGLLLTSVAVESLAWLRGHSRACDGLYRLVFA